MTRGLTTCLLAIVALAAPSAARAQSASAGDRLTLESAVRQALDNNRQLKSARLEVQKAEADLSASRTRRLPSFSTELRASQLITPVDFLFPQGAFGVYPGIGPIPSTNATVSVPRQPTMYVQSQIAQPITQLIQIGLGVRNAKAARDLEQERARAQELSLINDVKRLYFAILQSESALQAADEAIVLYRELDRSLDVRVAQQVALRSDAIDVRFQLAQEQLTRTTLLNAVASRKEQLNQLLGRDVRTPFSVEAVQTVAALEVDITAAQRHALESRPELREARLAVVQAELSRGLTKADRLPEVSVAVSYSSNFNMDVMPRNLATVGIKATWEPFDWGRRSHEYAAKSRTVEQARLNAQDVRDKIVVDVNSRFRTLAEKRAQLDVTEVAQVSAREKLRVATNQYQVQAVMLSGVLQQRAALADADHRYQEALLAFWTAKADFEQAIGEEVIR